jgi:hypothetical protein
MTPHEQKAQECALDISEEIGRYIVHKSLDRISSEVLNAMLRHFPEPQEKVCLWIIGTKSRKCGSSPIDPDKLFCPFCGGKIV